MSRPTSDLVKELRLFNHHEAGKRLEAAQGLLTRIAWRLAEHTYGDVAATDLPRILKQAFNDAGLQLPVLTAEGLIESDGDFSR